MSEITPGTKVKHPRYGEGYVNKTSIGGYEVFFETGGKMQLSRSNADLTILEQSTQAQETTIGPDINQMRDLMKITLDEFGLLPSNIPLGEKWIGGTMLLQAFNKELKPKEIPIETFFHKIVMLRDRLRVLEQNINSHPKLSDAEKVDFQQYITRIYGTLTTFNLLFDDKINYFVGAKSE